MKFLLLLITIFLMFSQICFAKNVSITAETNKMIVSEGDTIELTVTIDGNFNGEPELPNLDDFSILSQGVLNQTNIINFEYNKQMVYQYTLQPKKTGKLTIDSICINDRGSILKTKPIEITVTNGYTPKTNTRRRTPIRSNLPSFPFFNDSRKVILDANISKTNAYVGEQVILNLDILSGQDDYIKARVLPPSSKSFLTQSIEPAEFSSKQMFSRWMNCETRKFVLYPLDEGNLTIESFIVNYQTRFRNWQQQSTKKFNLTAKKLPEPRPENYANGVGNFVMTASTDSNNAQIGKPLTLSVTIEGNGNASGISINIPEFDGITKFNTNEKTEKHIQGNNVIETKTITITLIPQKTNGIIPELTASFFDPEYENYYTLTTKPIEIYALNPENSSNLQPIKNTNDNLSGYREIKETFTIKSQKPIYTNIAVITITLIPIFMYMLLTLVKSSKNIKKNKSENFKKLFKANLDYSYLSKQLFDFLVKKLELSQSVTVKNITDSLEEHKIDKETIEEIKEIFNICDTARFAEISSEKTPKEIAENCIKIVKKIEKMLKGGK